MNQSTLSTAYSLSKFERSRTSNVRMNNTKQKQIQTKIHQNAICLEIIKRNRAFINSNKDEQNLKRALADRPNQRNMSKPKLIKLLSDNKLAVQPRANSARNQSIQPEEEERRAVQHQASILSEFNDLGINNSIENTKTNRLEQMVLLDNEIDQKKPIQSREQGFHASQKQGTSLDNTRLFQQKFRQSIQDIFNKYRQQVSSLLKSYKQRKQII